MELHVTSKGIELTPEAQQHIQRKLGRLNRHFRNIIETRVEITEEKTKSRQHRFLARVTISGDNTRLHGEDRGETVLIAIDNVAKIMQRQVEHHKGKLRGKKSKGNSSIPHFPAHALQLVAGTPSLKRSMRLSVSFESWASRLPTDPRWKRSTTISRR